MVFHVLQDVKQSVQKYVGEDSDIDHCFDINPFQDLETEYLQNKFYHQHFNLLVSSNLSIREIWIKKLLDCGSIGSHDSRAWIRHSIDTSW